MKKIMNLLRYVPKKVVPIFALVAAVAVPVAIMAWGPSRETYTVEKPADHITFNSITNNPEVGDERNFVVVKDAANTAAGGWQDNLTVEPGKEYLVRMYVHNNAASELNLVAQNTRVMASVPTNTAKSIELNGFVTADNATPKQVWDQVTLKSDKDFNLAYVAGSTNMYNNVFGQAGTKLSDSIVTSAGALVGYDKLDGKIPGCFQYAAYVTFKVKPQFAQTANFTTTKEVSKHGENKWVESYKAQPGETVDYLIQYKNVAQAQQDNVVIKDTLPAGVSYVPGSTKLGNSLNPAGITVSDNITTTGINIGSYKQNGGAWVIFSGKVAVNDALPACGPNTLKNVARTTTDFGYKEDTADVTVDKTCVTPPAYACTGLDVIKISRTQFSFNAAHTVTNATFVKYTYTVKNAAGAVVKTITSTNDNAVMYENSTVGKYTVEATVTVSVNGQEKTSDVGNCKGAFEVKEAPVDNVYICESLKVAPVANTKDSFNFTVTPKTEGKVTVKEYVFNFGDGTTKTVSAGSETQTHTYKPGTYTASVSITFNVDGKTVTGVTSAACKVKVTVPEVPVAECKPGIPVGDVRCNPTTPPVTPPEVPTELPATGPEAAFAGILGSSALGMGITSWVRSRRSLKNLR